jgi:sugar lactone lactonase YvrE
VLSTILIPGEGWQLVSEGHQFTEGPAVNAAGEAYFNDLRAGRTLRVGVDGKVSEVLADSRRANGQHFGPDGRRYAVATQDQEIVAYDAAGVKSVVARGIAGNDLVVARNGDVYVTNPPAGSSNEPSKVWLLRPGKDPMVVDTGLRFANGVTLSPDQSLLYVADYRSHWVYSYQIRPDGSLAHKQRYFHLHEPDEEDMSFADGLRCDRDGRLYVATRLGIQVCDQAGRVNAIIPVPNGRVSNVCFGGPRFDTLYATCGDKVYRRRLNAVGANGWDVPHKPAAPKL